MNRPLNEKNCSNPGSPTTKVTDNQQSSRDGNTDSTSFFSIFFNWRFLSHSYSIFQSLSLSLSPSPSHNLFFIFLLSFSLLHEPFLFSLFLHLSISLYIHFFQIIESHNLSMIYRAITPTTSRSSSVSGSPPPLTAALNLATAIKKEKDDENAAIRLLLIHYRYYMLIIKNNT